MKKSANRILAVILCLSMIISSAFVFPIVASAEDLITFTAEDVTYTEGDATFSFDINVCNNPGIAEATVLLYFDPSEVEFVGSSLDGSVFDIDNSSEFDGRKVSTNKAYKSAVQAAGLTASSTYYVVAATLCTAVNDDGDYTEAITENGFAISAEFEPVGLGAGDSASIYVIIDSVYDIDLEDVDFETPDEVIITCESDPYVGLYDNFTVFGVTENSVVDPGSTVEIDLRADAAPALWAERLFMLYPETWSLTGYSNGNVFPDTAFNTSDKTDLSPVDNPMKALRTAAESFGINDLTGYRYYPLFWQLDGVYDFVEKNGLLAHLTFSVPADAEPATTAEILWVYNLTTDIILTDPGATSAADDDVIVSYTPDIINVSFTIAGEAICHHVNTTTDEVPATCTSDGYKIVTCDDCGEVLVNETYSSLGHSYKETNVPATCTVNGYYKKYCSVCNEEFEYTVHVAPGHNPGEPVVVPATCAAEGSEKVYCTVCSELISSSVLDITDHIPDAPVITPATCTESGLSEVYCKDCGTFLSSEVIPATGHINAQPVVISATCTENGVTRIFCEACGILLSEKLDAAGTGHDFEAVNVGSGSSAFGYTKYACKKCGEYYCDNITAPGTAAAVYADCEYTHSSGENGELTAKIYIANNPGVNTLVLDLGYNKDILRAVSVTNGSVFTEANGGSMFDVNTEKAPLVLYFEQNGVSNITANGLLAEVTFETVGDLGEFELTLKVDKKNTFAANAGGSAIVDVNIPNELAGTNAVAPHTFGEAEIIPATVTSSAMIKRVCTECGKEVIETVGTPEESEEVKVYGDLNGDGEITAMDANLLKKAVAGTLELNEAQSILADLDGNGSVTAMDANLMTKFVAGAINEFPAEAK